MFNRQANIHRFVRLLITARLMWHTSWKYADLTLNQILRQARLEWHGVRLGQPDWGSPTGAARLGQPDWGHDSHSIAFTAWSLSGGIVFHFMINVYSEQLTFELPPPPGLPGSCWRRWLDTSYPSPDDIVPWDEAQTFEGITYDLPPYSLAALLTSDKLLEDESPRFNTV